MTNGSGPHGKPGKKKSEAGKKTTSKSVKAKTLAPKPTGKAK